MITNLYIDGFNLYNRALKGTNLKWLDLRKLAQTLFPTDSINRIKYFTARVSARPSDPNQPQRQQAYFRALETIPDCTLHYGVFRARQKQRPLVNPVPGLPRYVWIHDTEEKGTDVNLATLLLVDGYAGDYEQAIVVSNDSDLAFPIEVVRDRLGLRIAVVNPDRDNHTHKDLAASSTYVR